MLAVSILLITFFPIINLSPQSDAWRDSIINHTLNPIVVSAKRISTDIANSDTRLEILDSSFIQNSCGYRLGDILKNSSSLFVRSYGHSFSLQTASMNGLGSSSTLVLYDGIRMNSFQNSGLDLALIPKSLIGSIEIIGNGVSSLYGSEAIGGVINVLSPDLKSGNVFDFSAGASLGSFSTKNYTFDFGQRISSFSSRVFYTTTTSKGNYRYYFDNAGETIEKEREMSGYNGYDVGLHLSFEPAPDLSVKLISAFTRQYKEIAGLETGTPPSISNQLDRNWNNILSVKKEISSTFKLSSFLNFQNNYSNYYLKPLPLSVYHNLIYSNGTNAEISFNRIKLLLGYDLAYASLRSNELEGFAKRFQYAFSFYSEIEPLKFIKVFPSLRYEHFSDLDNQVFTGGFGFNIKPFTDIPLHIKGNTSSNFRAPSFNDLYWKNAGNGELKPEKAVNYEAGIIGFFNLFFNGSAEFSFKEIKSKDKIVWTPNRNRLWSPKNIGSSISKVYSLNLTLEKSFGNSLSVSLAGGYTITEAIKTSSDFLNDPSLNKYLIYVPLNTANGRINVKIGELGFNLFYTMPGKRYSDQENIKYLEPYRLISGNLTYRFLLPYGSVSVKFEVDNLFNENYQVMPGYPMPLMNHTLTFSFNY